MVIEHCSEHSQGNTREVLHKFTVDMVIKLVDVSYGGENGFNQAIELAAESLQNVKFIQEKKLIGRYLHANYNVILYSRFV